MSTATTNQAGRMAHAGASRSVAPAPAAAPFAGFAVATSWLLSTDAGYPATGTFAVRTVPVAKPIPAHKHLTRPSEPSP